MSPTVDNFVHDLVAMAKAYDTLPGLEAENKQLQEQHLHDGDIISRLELRIIDLKNQQDETLTKLRSVEAERDEAGFRQLETEDKIATLVRTFQTVHATVGQGVAAATGSEKDITVMVSAEEHDEWEEHKARLAYERVQKAEEARLAAEEAARPKPEAVVDFPVAHAEPWAIQSPSAEGQSESPPTPQGVSSEAGQGSPVEQGQSEPLPTQAGQDQPMASGSDFSKGKYFGKRYHDWNYYVPLASWLEGGGTEKDYNWRPASINISRGY